MDERPPTIWRALPATLLAATVGSFLGAAIFWLAVDTVRSGRTFSLGDVGIGAFLIVLTGFAGAVLTIPLLALLALPLTWPVRRQISAHPFLSAAALGVLGAFLGRGLYAGFSTSLSAHQYYDAAGCVGLATAVVWVFTLRRLQRKMN